MQDSNQQDNHLCTKQIALQLSYAMLANSIASEVEHYFEIKVLEWYHISFIFSYVCLFFHFDADVWW